MVDEFNDLTVMHDYAWTLILRGTVDHKSPAPSYFWNHWTTRMPELRTVVLTSGPKIHPLKCTQILKVQKLKS